MPALEVAAEGEGEEEASVPGRETPEELEVGGTRMEAVPATLMRRTAAAVAAAAAFAAAVEAVRVTRWEGREGVRGTLDKGDEKIRRFQRCINKTAGGKGWKEQDKGRRERKKQTCIFALTTALLPAQAPLPLPAA